MLLLILWQLQVSEAAMAAAAIVSFSPSSPSIKMFLTFKYLLRSLG